MDDVINAHEEFLEAERFITGLGIPMTFFVVPKPRGTRLDEIPEMVSALRDVARKPDRDFGLHGLTHGGYEFGLPHPHMASLMGEKTVKDLARRRDEICQEHTVEQLGTKLREAMELYENIFGERPRYFRSPCAMTCDALYRSLSDAGIRFDSSQIINWKMWRYFVSDFETNVGWDTEVPPRLYPGPHGVTIIPIMAEYFWYIKRREDAELFLKTALDDFRRARDLGGIFTPICHVNPLQPQQELDREVLTRLVEALRKFDDVEFCTFKELCGL
jgi:peptidoglycan/xylan/chitin deacetylase (PgdA/CDA1 family)